jgi:hypothetical protein
MNNSGDTAEGPVCVKVYYNALRYDIGHNVTVTATPGPDVSGAVTVKTTGGGVSSGNPGKSNPANVTQISPDVEQISSELANTEGTLNSSIQYDDAKAANLTNALSTLATMVDLSNTTFDQGGATGVLAAMKAPPIVSALADGEAATWRATDALTTSLQGLKDRATKLQASSPNPADAASLSLSQTKIASDLTAAAPYMVAGDKTASFQKQRSIFSWWDGHIQGLKAENFTAQVYVGCNISTNSSKSSAIKVSGLDNSPRFAGQQPTALSISGNVATVTCTTPFVISAGIEISFLKSPTFGLVPSGTSGSNVFGITDEGGVNPMALAMAHWRIHDFEGHKIGFYGSFGTAAHVQSAAAGGSAAEYISGMSLGFFRTAFVSAGWHLGKVSKLDGGYKVGDPVPSGVTTVPVTSSYKSGFGLAITFTKP